MIPREDILKILEAGTKAPSGDNAQPWRFVVRNDTVEVYNVPRRDTSQYNIHQRGSMIAHGALLENCMITTQTLGYRLMPEILPDEARPDLTVRFTFSPASPSPHPLVGAIEVRCTNRKMYHPEPLADSELAALRSAALGNNGIRMLWETDRATIAEIARAASANELVLFQNKTLHDFFFDHVRWTHEEEMQKGGGFFVPTLEINAPMPLFRILRKWGAMKFFNRLGMAKKISKENEKVFSSAAALGMIVAPGRAPRNYFAAGQAFERIWLTATSLGLSLQPMIGVLYLYDNIITGADAVLNPDERLAIGTAYKKINSAFSIGNGVPAAMFRVGHAPPPSARSSRIPVEQVTTWE